MSFEPPEGRWGYRRMLAPDRKPYPTRDGFVAALPYRDNQWRAFFAAVGHSQLYEGDPRFTTDEMRLENINDLYVMVARLTLERTTAEWLALFKKLDIAAMPVNSIEDLIDNQHLRDVNFFETIDHPSEGPIRQIRSTSRWSDTQPAAGRYAPQLGEQSRELLCEAGYSSEEVDDLVARKIVKEWVAPGK